MKIRNGFVSNSSTSSFMVLKKDNKMSFEDKVAKSEKELNAYCDYGDYPEEIERFVTEPAKKYAENGQYILMKTSVDWGGEEAVNEILPLLLDKLGVDGSLLTFEWGE
jgi:hypothetical protein